MSEQQADAVSIENVGLPNGRLPKELFGVCLTYRIDTYPHWEKAKPGKTRTAVKNAKKRQYFLFTKKSSMERLLKRFTSTVVFDDQTVTTLHGHIEWDEVETWNPEKEES